MQVVPLPWDTPSSSASGSLRVVRVQVDASDFGIFVSDFFLDLFRGLKLLVLTSRPCGLVSRNTAHMYARAVLLD